MEKSMVDKIEMKLKQLLENRKALHSGTNQDAARKGAGTIIRRRRGENDRRIFVTLKKTPSLHRQSSEADKRE